MIIGIAMVIMIWFHHLRYNHTIYHQSILIRLNDKCDGLVSMMHQLPHMPKMGLAPISPLPGALLWATTARGWYGVVVGAAVVAAAEAIDIATAAGYVGIAALVAALNNIIYKYCLYCSYKAIFYAYQCNHGWIYQPLLYCYIDWFLMWVLVIWWWRW